MHITFNFHLVGYCQLVWDEVIETHKEDNIKPFKSEYFEVSKQSNLVLSGRLST